MPDYTLRLNRQSTPQSIPGTRISFIAPGLRGELSVDRKPAPGVGQLTVRSSLRDSSEIGPSDSVDQAIQEIGILDAYNLETEAPTPEVARSEGVRAGTGTLEDDEVALDYEPKPDEYSFVVYRDEDGAMSIHFPEQLATPTAAEGVRATGGPVQHYRIALRRATGPATLAAGETQTRFGIVTIGKKLLKLIV